MTIFLYGDHIDFRMMPSLEVHFQTALGMFMSLCAS